MTYPTRVRPLPASALVATRWLVLAGTLAAGSLFGCSDDAANTDPIGDTTPTTGTQTATTSAFTSVTTGNTSSITSGTSAGTLTTNSASATTSGTTTSGTSSSSSSSSASSSGSVGSTTGTTGGAGGGTGTSGTDTTGTGAGGTGGTGNTTDFQPCPETGPCKVLPLGDSITVGLGFDGGYRVELFHLALEGGHEITFTGTQQPNGPAMVDGVTFPTNHEGISGQLISEIGNRIPSPGLNEMPNIILVHAGTNDMVRMASGASDRLRTLMDELIAEAPDALIVMGNIVPLPGNGSIDGFNAAVPLMVEERATSGAHVIFADQFTGFEASDLGDGVHPNQGGYSKMAAVWFEAIEPYLR